MALHPAYSGKLFATILVLVAAHLRGPVVPVVEDRQHPFDVVPGGFQRRLGKELAVQLVAGIVNRPAALVLEGQVAVGYSTQGDRFFAPCVAGCSRPKF